MKNCSIIEKKKKNQFICNLRKKGTVNFIKDMGCSRNTLLARMIENRISILFQSNKVFLSKLINLQMLETVFLLLSLVSIQHRRYNQSQLESARHVTILNRVNQGLSKNVSLKIVFCKSLFKVQPKLNYHSLIIWYFVAFLAVVVTTNHKPLTNDQ